MKTKRILDYFTLTLTFDLEIKFKIILTLPIYNEQLIGELLGR